MGYHSRGLIGGVVLISRGDIVDQTGDSARQGSDSCALLATSHSANCRAGAGTAANDQTLHAPMSESSSPSPVAQARQARRKSVSRSTTVTARGATYLVRATGTALAGVATAICSS